MAHAGILGNLRYSEQENGWALIFGNRLARYEIYVAAILSEKEPDNEAQRAKYEKEIGVLLKSMNHELKNRKVDFQIPVNQDNDGLNYLLQDLFQQFIRQSRASELAFVIIGHAAYYLILRNISPVSDDEAVVQSAFDMLDNLTYRCEDANVQIDALFAVLSGCQSFRDLRRLLKNLQTQMTILVVSADPRDQARLRLGRELKALQNALGQNFKFATLPSCRPQDLASGIRRHRPALIHFSGHGSEKALCFEDNMGRTVEIHQEKLAGLFSLACETGLKGVVLNACHTAEQADSIADAVGHVVAMEGLVGDDAAIDFASQFYAAIGDGEEFSRAFQWALAGTGLIASTGPLKPVLKRSKVLERAYGTYLPPRKENEQTPPKAGPSGTTREHVSAVIEETAEQAFSTAGMVAQLTDLLRGSSWDDVQSKTYDKAYDTLDHAPTQSASSALWTKGLLEMDDDKGKTAINSKRLQDVIGHFSDEPDDFDADSIGVGMGKGRATATKAFGTYLTADNAALFDDLDELSQTSEPPKKPRPAIPAKSRVLVESYDTNGNGLGKASI